MVHSHTLTIPWIVKWLEREQEAKPGFWRQTCGGRTTKMARSSDVISFLASTWREEKISLLQHRRDKRQESAKTRVFLLLTELETPALTLTPSPLF